MYTYFIYILVGGLEHFLFSTYCDRSSQLTFIFFGGMAQPPTKSYAYNVHVCLKTGQKWAASI